MTQRTANREPGSAFKAFHPAETQGRSIHHKKVSRVHTAVVISFRQDPDLVRSFENGFPAGFFLFGPAACLIGTGNGQKEADIAVCFTEADHSLSGQGVESAGTAAHVGSVAAFVCLLQGGR